MRGPTPECIAVWNKIPAKASQKQRGVFFFVVLCSTVEDKMSSSEKPDAIAASKLCILALTMGFVVMAKVITSFSSKCADLSCNTPVLFCFFQLKMIQIAAFHDGSARIHARKFSNHAVLQGEEDYSVTLSYR